MHNGGDWFIMMVAASVMTWWVIRRFDRWLHEPPNSRLRQLAVGGSVQEDDHVFFLRENGYEVLTAKHRISLGIAVDDQPTMPTRLYFDYLAKKDDKYYLVKVDRLRHRIEWTASSLRERLLVFALLFPDCEGVLVIGQHQEQIHLVKFKVGVEI